MKRILLALVAIFAFASVEAAKPIKIIFDTDMGNDVDDVIALDMLYKYQDEGRIDLSAFSRASVRVVASSLSML